MPFRESSRLEERVAMMADYDTGSFTVSELCREYEVSRPTFYGLVKRRASGDAAWFVERSHAPLSCPHRTPEAVCAAVLEVKRRFPRFGPKKVRARLLREQPQGVRPVVERLFAEHGLPRAMRCDNGPPFGSPAAGGLSRLSVWWLKLGIEPHAIRPASPQDNGRHERMHRTLKADTAAPPADSPAEQQARFDAFRAYYNRERPHEALPHEVVGQIAPAQLWTPSARPMPTTLAEPWYDPDHRVCRVRTNGEIKWRGDFVFISEVLRGERLGLIERDDGAHIVRFFNVPLGVLDPSGAFRRFAPRRHRLRSAPEPQPQQNL